MGILRECHKRLNEKGEGKCSVPMWVGGMPAGFCDNVSYGEETEIHKRDNHGNNYIYIPALACPCHGGPRKEEIVNLCDDCKNHIAECDGNPKFGCGKGNDNVYECDGFCSNK